MLSKLPLLPSILAHTLMEIILWHTFPSTPGGTIYSTLPLALPFFLIFQQHPEAISSHFLSFVPEQVVVSQGLGSVQGLMTHPLPHCLGALWEFTF